MQSDKYEFFIAGVQFHQAKTIINDLSPDDELDMVEEPSNKFDPNAVALLYNEVMLGYVPAKFSASVTAFLETADNPVCILKKVDPKAKTYEQLFVKIYDIGLEAFEDETMDYDEDDEEA